MDFRPLNSDHAVQTASFNFLLDGIVPPEAAQALRYRKELLAELPAVQNPEVLELTPGGVTKAQRIGGIQLSHLRPDGTPSWALRIVGNEVSVECSRYTRWDRVWESASRYLSAGLEAAQQAKRQVMVVGLTVADTFIANREPYDLRTLLREGPNLADRVFRAGPTWHNHIGWFGQSASLKPGSYWLNQLNIDAARISDELRINIAHNQELRQDQPSPIDLAQLPNLFRELHLHNKEVLFELLRPEMAQQIGLKVNG